MWSRKYFSNQTTAVTRHQNHLESCVCLTIFCNWNLLVLWPAILLKSKFSLRQHILKLKQYMQTDNYDPCTSLKHKFVEHPKFCTLYLFLIWTCLFIPSQILTSQKSAKSVLLHNFFPNIFGTWKLLKTYVTMLQWPLHIFF